ncbi:MAG: glycosyltransferase family 39 protein [Deltaproteobacteria bacterium]|nr:glycosyltransferase family 39 protein [Deltaproteobacteria bacterium]
MGPDRVGGRQRPVRIAFAVVLALQVLLAVWGVADRWTRGHNGWNGSAYHNAARNTLRWDVLFPLQYETANVPPKKEQLYTHAPLALHLHNVASVKLFGDRELSIRLVAGFWSVAALCMLFAVVRRLWDDAHALAASAIYVVLPINAIYTNMANHSSGFIFWSLLTLYLYIRSTRAPPWRRADFALFLAIFAIAASWDWPAYYIAACIALHWAWGLFGPRRSEPASGPASQLAIFCAWVVLLFAGHFVLVEVMTGNVDELRGAFNARRALSWARFRTHLWIVPELMFTAPVLGLCAAWMGMWGARMARGTARGRDLIPVAFLVAGLIHYWTFRWSAIVHSYWAWPILPAVAIVVPVSLFAMARWIRDRAGIALSFSVLLLLVPLAIRTVELVPEGRYVGGSMWFFTPVRGAMDTYDSGRPELRFAERVKAWTDRDTGVQLHTSLKPLRLEPRFNITLDRVTHRWSQNPRVEIPNSQGATGWVFVAALDAFPEEQRAAFASRHPYRQFGDYFMVDLRTEARDIEAWGLTPLEPNARWWLFHTSFEPPMRAIRLIAAEQSLNEKVAELDAP